MKILKIGIVGDQGVGKSSLISSFISHSFNPVYDPTVGIDFKEAPLSGSDRNNYMIQIWEVSGDPVYSAFAKTLFQDFDGLIIVYDVNNFKSFQNTYDFWLHEVRRHSCKVSSLHKCTMLFGTRLDEEDDLLDVLVDYDEQKKICSRYDIPLSVSHILLKNISR